jgi:hypothetical protein
MSPSKMLQLWSPKRKTHKEAMNTWPQQTQQIKSAIAASTAMHTESAKER